MLNSSSNSLGRQCPKPVRKANGLDDEDNNCVRNLFAVNSSQKNVNQCSDELFCPSGRVTSAYSCHQINRENSCDMQYYVPQENPVQSHTITPEYPQDVSTQLPTGNEIMPDNIENLEAQYKANLDDVNRSKSAPQLDSTTGGCPSTAVHNHQIQENSLKAPSNQLQMQSSMYPYTKFGELPLNQSSNYHCTGHKLQNQSIPKQYSEDIPPEMKVHSSYYPPTLPQSEKITSHIHIQEPSLPAGINNCPHHGTYAKAMYHSPNPFKRQKMYQNVGMQNIPELQQWQCSQDNLIPDMNNNGTFNGFYNNCPEGRNHYVLTCSKDLQILDADDSSHICNGNKI